MSAFKVKKLLKSYSDLIQDPDLKSYINIGKKLKASKGEEKIDIDSVNRSLWDGLFNGVNFNYKNDGFINHLVKLKLNFDKDSILHCLKSMDFAISPSSNKFIYDKFQSFLKYEILDTGDVVLSLNNVIADNENCILYQNRDFKWLMSFIFYNRKDSSFNFDPLNEKPWVDSFDQFEKYGYETTYHIENDSFEIKISKGHLPFLEEQIGFQVKN